MQAQRQGRVQDDAPLQEDQRLPRVPGYSCDGGQGLPQLRRLLGYEAVLTRKLTRSVSLPANGSMFVICLGCAVGRESDFYLARFSPASLQTQTTACVCKEWSDWDATCKPNDKGVCKTTRHCKKTNGSPECPATPATEDKDCPNYAGCSGMRPRSFLDRLPSLPLPSCVRVSHLYQCQACLAMFR